MSKGLANLATFKILDKANEYRIQIVGRFAGLSVVDVESAWKSALQANLQRQLVVDISRIDGYDSGGKALLREMHKHGTLIAASTAVSLVFLEEITSARRGPSVLQEAPSPKDRANKTGNFNRALASGK